MNFANYAFVTILLFPLFGSGATGTLQRYVPSKKKMVAVEVQSYGKFTLTKNCFKGNVPNCLAWRATQAKAASNQGAPLLGHPAARYCNSVGAVNLLFMDKKTEVDFCEFKDGSAINSWDLYNAHH